LSVFFTALLVMIIVRGERLVLLVQGTEIINPFTRAALDRCIPYLVLLGALALVVNGLKLYWARWTLPLCIANIVNNIVFVCIAVYVLHWPDLFSEGFVSFIGDLGEDAGFFSNLLSSGAAVLFLTVVVSIGAAIDIVLSVRNTWKGMRE